ncbi:MAG: carbon monoxide dehydrogenase subunit [Marmoricola sp.]|nr:carbon monoxide dehydrogenase subunit [Marmoricola sp.]
MELRHEFTVPATLEESWNAFNDIESVAECFPGATVTSVEGDTFQGSCKVKLGPIALVYNGSGTFVEKDEAAHRMVIDAKGKDKRGNGTAGAHVVATMTQEGTSTRIEVLTDLNVTGKPAQFGRGVMQDVSDKLLGQFTACLEKKVGDSSAATAAAAAGAAATGAAATDTAATDAAASVAAATEPDPEARLDNVRDLSTRETNKPGNDDALDLGATVLPVIARAYWKHALGALLVLLVLRRLLRRR